MERVMSGIFKPQNSEDDQDVDDIEDDDCSDAVGLDLGDVQEEDENDLASEADLEDQEFNSQNSKRQNQHENLTCSHEQTADHEENKSMHMHVSHDHNHCHKNSAESAKEHEAHQLRAKHHAEVWAGKGLGLLPDGSVPTGMDAVKHAVCEFARGSVRGAALGMSIKGALSLVLGLLKGVKNWKRAVSNAVGPDSRRFAGFMGAFVGCFRLTNAAMTSYTGQDTPFNSGVAGTLAGLTLLLDAQHRRQMISLNLFVRAVDVAVKGLVRKDILPYWKHFEALMFGICNVPIMYGFLFEPDILERGYYKWILHMGDVTDKGLAATLRVRRQALAEGRDFPFQPCCVGYHEGPCTVHCLKDWVFGLKRASKVYVSVHLLGLALHYKSLMKDPSSQLLKTAIGFASSCAFLSTYVLCIKGSQCFLRNMRQTDSDWHAVVAGLLTSFSTYFERPSRVSELMLYCFPKSLEGAYIYLRKRKLIGVIKHFDAMLFMVTMGLLASSAKTDFKSSYFTTMCFILGSQPTKAADRDMAFAAAAAAPPPSSSS